MARSRCSTGSRGILLVAFFLSNAYHTSMMSHFNTNIARINFVGREKHFGFVWLSMKSMQRSVSNILVV
jgi:hypothetical protein